MNRYTRRKTQRHHSAAGDTGLLGDGGSRHRIFAIIQLVAAVSILVAMIYLYIQKPRFSAPKAIGLVILWIALILQSIFRRR